MAEEVKAEEFTNDVDVSDYQAFEPEEVECVDETGDHGKMEDMIEIDACEADDDKEKADKPEASKAPQTDAEADEHDLVAMPMKHIVMKELGELNSKKRLVIRTLQPDDLLNPILHDVIRSKACSSASFEYISSSDEEHSKIGIMTITFTTSKQTMQAMASIQAIRENLEIECVPVVDSPNAVIEKWRKENAGSNQLTGPMLIVKNLDPATSGIEKLLELFPDAEDVVISSQPQTYNLGKLKGTKHAFLIYADEDQANAALLAFKENPVPLDGRDLIVNLYKEPPNHIPEGYLVLTTRKLVLRQIARAKGLMVRCQEDPTYELAPVWPERLKRATEMIEKDDAARDLLGLPKPTLLEFKDMTCLKQLTVAESERILSRFDLADAPAASASAAATGNSNYRKRPSQGNDFSTSNAKRGNNRGGMRGSGGSGGGRNYSSPNVNNRGGRGGGSGGRGGNSGGRSYGSGGYNTQSQAAGMMRAPPAGGMMFGMMQPRLPRLISPPTGIYGALTPGPGNFPLPAPGMMGGALQQQPRGRGGYGRY